METENNEKNKLRDHFALIWILQDVRREELTN